MKLTLSWLKDHLETDATLDEIVETLTTIGLEVESVDNKSLLKPFKIARVLTAYKHPNADRLKVLSVDIGNGELIQVICGAQNARSGLVGVFAAPGIYVPGIDMTISVSKIRDVVSYGMMCSEHELQISDEHHGIIDLPPDAPVGMSFASYAGLDDPIIEIGLTPNRADCASVYGIARDLAAAGLGTLKENKIVPVKWQDKSPIHVLCNFGDTAPLCFGFAHRGIKGVKNGPSPKWLQQRLIAIGLRPINALVDITNYITFDRGRPLHVFDASKIKGNLTVRRARNGETIVALDGRIYDLDSEICVISDESAIQSIAGIVGGKHAGCDENTTEVLIESALWDPCNIARAGRELNIITDARYRFERGVDPEFMVSGLELATQMILDLCGGTPTKIASIDCKAHVPKKIAFPISEVKRLTGIEIAKDEIFDILSRLGFRLDGTEQTLHVTVPSWRPDVDGKADLVEEIMRIYGINRIEPQPLSLHRSMNGKILTTLQIRTRTTKRALAARGMMEAVTWSFIPEAHAQAFGGGISELKLANPISADLSNMRPSLLPGLITATQRNADRGFNDLALFEVSETYEGDKQETQRRVASGVRRGTAKLNGPGRHWADKATSVDVFDAKADALAVLDACGVSVDRIQIESGGPPWYHPGRSSTITLDSEIVLGDFGEFHPKTLETLEAEGALCGFEMFIDAIPEPILKATRKKHPLSLSAFQAVHRDFAFVVEKSVKADAIMRAASAADKELITHVQIFDLFEDISLGENQKSVAIEVVIQPQEHTLTDEELKQLSRSIVENVAKQTGGTLRR